MSLLLTGLVAGAGCGEEEKQISQSQVADYNKPAIVYITTTWEADVTVPVLDYNTDALINFVAAEVLAGRVPNDENEMLIAALAELLTNPQNYVIATNQSDTRPMEVTSNGNGFIVSSDGYLVTNAHIIKESEENLDYLMAEEAAASAILDELAYFEEAWFDGEELTGELRERFIVAGLSVYADYITVSDAKSRTQVYTGDIIEKAREQEKGFTAETVKVGDPLDQLEETGKDVAILKINADNLPTVELGDESSVRDGDGVTALSFISTKSEQEVGESFGALEDKPTIVTGSVAGRRTMQDDWDVIQLQIPLKAGSSGSPIFNSKGEVVGVETFGTVQVDSATGIEQNIETQNYAVPVSVVKQFMSQSNVSASEGLSQTYREGIDLFHEERYSAAKKKFEEVRTVSAAFPYIEDYIGESQANINKGLDKGGFPIALVFGIVAALVVIAAAVLILLLVVLPRRKKRGGPGAPGSTQHPPLPGSPG